MKTLMNEITAFASQGFQIEEKQDDSLSKVIFELKLEENQLWVFVYAGISEPNRYYLKRFNDGAMDRDLMSLLRNCCRIILKAEMWKCFLLFVFLEKNFTLDLISYSSVQFLEAAQESLFFSSEALKVFVQTSGSLRKKFRKITALPRRKSFNGSTWLSRAERRIS
jgi:hypothetical protein